MKRYTIPIPNPISDLVGVGDDSLYSSVLIRFQPVPDVKSIKFVPTLATEGFERSEFKSSIVLIMKDGRSRED